MTECDCLTADHAFRAAMALIAFAVAFMLGRLWP